MAVPRANNVTLAAYTESKGEEVNVVNVPTLAMPPSTRNSAARSL
jgi:hypothetical protein